MLYRKVPKGTNWFYTLGSATLFAFVIQAITGVFLAMFYTPSPTEAYASITHINNDVFLGEFVHGMHKWGASVMIILIFLHMGRTFFFGAYKYPRELNWVIGVVLLILTMVMGLTGYLLPFDQRSFWATIVANNITATGPVVGPYLADFLRAGPEFGATTLSRFYAIHMLLVPGRDHRPDRRPPLPGGQARHHGAALAEGREAEAGTAGRATQRRRNGGGDGAAETRAMNNRDKEQYLQEYEVLKKKGKPFFPYAVLKDSAMVLIVAVVVDRDVDHARRRAGPEGRPDHDHLRAAARVVLLLPLRAAAGDEAAVAGPVRDVIGIPTIAMVLLLLLPFYDRGPERRPERRPIATTAGILTIVAMAYLTYLGATGGSPTEIDMQVAEALRAGQGAGRRVGLPRLPQARRERQQRARGPS